MILNTFDDFSALKRSICAYFIAFKKHHISPNDRKTYDPRDTSFIFRGAGGPILEPQNRANLVTI